MELGTLILSIAGLISACGVIIGAVNKIFNKKLGPIETKIDELNIEQCRQFLIDTMADIDAGMTKNPIQIARLYEVYDRYTRAGGNSYIHEEWERLQKEGKIIRR